MRTRLDELTTLQITFEYDNKQSNAALSSTETVGNKSRICSLFLSSKNFLAVGPLSLGLESSINKAPKQADTQALFY